MRNSATPAKPKPRPSARDKAIDDAVAQFFKSVELTARRELEKRLRAAFKNGTVKPGDRFNAGVGVSSTSAGLDVIVYGKMTV